MCERIDVDGARGDNDNVKTDTSTVRICGVDISGRELALGKNVRSLDLFIYSDAGAKRLESYSRFTFPADGDSLAVTGKEGDKTAVAIINSRYEYNVEALDAFDSAELLKTYIEDEDTSAFMAGVVVPFRMGDELKLYPQSLATKIILKEISHEFPDYKRMEDPFIYLTNVPAWGEMFRDEGLRTTDYLNDTTSLKGLFWERLPYDIGMYPQQPNTTLYTYPNYDELQRTVLVLEYSTDGRKYKCSTDLPVIERGKIVEVTLEVGDKASDYEFNFRVRKNQSG